MGQKFKPLDGEPVEVPERFVSLNLFFSTILFEIYLGIFPTS